MKSQKDEIGNVVFEKRCGVFMPKDQAGFPLAQAKFLIQSGAARALEQLPVAMRGDNLDGTKDMPVEGTDEYGDMVEAEVQKRVEAEVQKRLQEARGGGGGNKHGR